MYKGIKNPISYLIKIRRETIKFIGTSFLKLLSIHSKLLAIASQRLVSS